MIRKLQAADIDRVADIWLNTNIEAHDFIPIQYWKSNFDSVKEMFQHAEVYVYEDKKGIQGFAGLSNEYIEGIFVSKTVQSQGIGSFLLNFIKGRKEKLQLNVYEKNTRAIRFYQREGFQILCKSLDENTGEKEYVMVWLHK